MTIDADLLLKLFDTLKEADKLLVSKIEKQTDAIITITHSVENIKESVNKHIDHTDSISDSSKEAMSTIKLIWDKTRKMYKSVNTIMIGIVIAFGLMTISYYFVRSSIENMVTHEISKTEIQFNQDANNYEDLSVQIEELRRMMKELQPN